MDKVFSHRFFFFLEGMAVAQVIQKMTDSDSDMSASNTSM